MIIQYGSFEEIEQHILNITDKGSIIFTLLQTFPYPNIRKNITLFGQRERNYLNERISKDG